MASANVEGSTKSTTQQSLTANMKVKVKMQTIRLNSSGKDVELLQQLLCKWGYKITGTGTFDHETDAAVRVRGGVRQALFICVLTY